MTSESAVPVAPDAPAVISLLAATPPPERVESTVVDRLGRVVEAAVEVLEVDSVGLLLVDEHNQLQTAAFTDPPASALEDLQVLLGEGPGMDSWTSGQTVAVTDLETVPGYATLWADLAKSGIRSVLSAPIAVHGAMVGNLNLARHRAHVWSVEEIRAAETYAKVIGVTLDLAARTASSAGRLARLRTRWHTSSPAGDDPETWQ